VLLKVRKMTDARQIIHYARVSSTQSVAKKLVSLGIPVGTVIVADKQEQGRGRLDRTWISPVGGLYASVILQAEPLISLRAGIAVAKGLRELGIEARLRWPNDVMVEEKKIGGILIEVSGSRAIVGMGVNLVPVPLESATCVARETCVHITRDQLLALILQWMKPSLSGKVVQEYRALSATIGRTVCVESKRGKSIGKAIGIDVAGRLLVESAGVVHVISSGDCSNLSFRDNRAEKTVKR